MISCPTTSVVLLALLASTLLARVAFSSVSAVDDTKYNGICDVDICTCFTYDGTACPDWMGFPTYQGGGGSFSYGNATDDDAGQALACYAYGAKFSDVKNTYTDAFTVSSNQTESPMNFLTGISIEYWIVGVGEENQENSMALVNYTASDPAPDCSTVTPPAQWSSSSKYNGICDVDICTCFTYDGASCPDWMDRGGPGNEYSGSFFYGNATDDDSRQALACYAYGTKFRGASTTDNDGSVVSSDNTESPMNFLNGVSLESWIVRVGGEHGKNDMAIVHYTASDPAPDCSTVTPPAQWSSSSEQISLLPASIITIVAVVATLL